MASVNLSRNLWDPSRVLDVYPHAPGFTEQFNTSQRATAVKCLESMSEVHPSRITLAALSLLAQNTLCRDYHQRQADTKITEWKEKIEHYLNDYSERRPVVRPGRQLQYERDDMKQLQNSIAKDDHVSEQELKATHQALDRVKAELEESQARCSELTEQNNKLDRQREGDQAANSRDVALLVQHLTKSWNQQHTEEVENLKRQLEGRNANFKGEIAASSNEARGLKVSNAQLVKQLDVVKQEVAERDQQVEQLVKQKDVVKQELAKRDQQVEQLVKQKDVVEQLVTQMDKVNQELAEREDKLPGLQPQNVKKSLFAELLRQTPKVLLRKISKIMRAGSAPYVQSVV
ncbi:MAG: hypothetical protein ASARMPREDX12_002421 [Alectoria sarmentosa]|nr:MAG: hypothetical protein ASARMPREDX12_002421 [Alectoria sarmentosa]